MEPIDDELAAALGRWLSPRLDSEATVTLEGKPGSGYSAETLVFTATTAAGDERLVLRRDTAGPSPYPEQAEGLGNGVALQHTVARALDGRVPVAPIVGYEPSPDGLGAPFFVMRFVAGVVPIEDPPCTREGFYAEAPPALRTAMHESGLAAMAALHAVPWRSGPLAALDPPGTTPGAARQLDLCTAHLEAGLRGRTAPVFDDALAFLRSTVPAGPARDDVVLLWGDGRLGNVIWGPDDGEARALTDFESVAVGERELDLGWWLMADRWMHEGSDVERLPGEPTRAEQVALYERAAGRTVGPTGWYEVFAALRFSMTAVHVLTRWEQNGALPPDHPYWRDNPATLVLRQLLDEQGAAS